MAIQHAVSLGLFSLYFAFSTPFVSTASEKYCYYNDTYHLSDVSCTRLCHCASGDCGEDDSGRCPCAAGWMGDHCQYANIASTMISTSTGYNITLRINYPVSAMHLRLIEKGTYHLMIRIGVEEKLASSDTCFYGLVSYNDTNVDIFCDYPVPGNMIMLQTNMTINHDVEVYGGRNVALWQTTAQSSNYLTWIAGYAVDGRIGPPYFSTGGTCTHTRITPSAWWSVKLDRVYGISWIYIANRDKVQYRLGAFHLLFVPDLMIFQDATDFSDNPWRNIGDFITIDVSNSDELPAKTTHENYVNITIDSSRIPNRDFNSPLVLCEVQLYACRPRKSGSENCLGFCSDNCVGDAFCNKYDCGLCKKGWIGRKCNKRNASERYCTESTRKTTCDVGHCDACDYLCHCRDGAECDLYTGECLTGCDKGWMGRACQYANMAYQRTNETILSDGNKTTCQSSASTTTTVGLLRRTVILALRIVIENGSTVPVPILSTHVKTEKGFIPCNTNLTIHNEGDIVCSQVIRGTAIFIASSTPVNLCEIQIYGEVTCSISSEKLRGLSSNETNYRYNETVVASCKEGYEPFNTAVLRRTFDGMWSSTVPLCNGKTVQSESNQNFCQGRDIALMTVVPILIILLILTSFLLFQTRRQLVKLRSEKSENRAYMDMSFPTTKEEATYSELQPTT